MAYRYNEKTGEFEEYPKRVSSTPSRPTTGGSSYRPSGTSYTPTGRTSSTNSGESFGGCLLSILGFIAINVVPYLIIGGLVSLCSS